MSSTESTTHTVVPSDHTPAGLPLSEANSMSLPASRCFVDKLYANSLSSEVSATHTVAPSDQIPAGDRLPAAANVSKSPTTAHLNAVLTLRFTDSS